jgi:uncharacterized protein
VGGLQNTAPIQPVVRAVDTECMPGRFNRSSWVRILPFAAFMALLALRGWAGGEAFVGLDPRWIYGVAVGVVTGLLLFWWREYRELSQQLWPSTGECALALFTGLVVFGLWIQLDAPWMTLGEPTARFVPTTASGGLDWPLIVVRFAGAALLVPVMEELFWRSFLMRWLHAPSFAGVDPQTVGFKAIVLSTFVFTLAHTLWLAAAIAGLAYAWLYVRTGKLWVAVIAHAVTNAALGVWVVGTGQWKFW